MLRQRDRGEDAGGEPELGHRAPDRHPGRDSRLDGPRVREAVAGVRRKAEGVLDSFPGSQRCS
ncbi:MAG: hypothetical protein MZV63_37430 [Marinilabiliales bacterium]|nr:hypothetical protein [Marinilabiliales bacterium]